MRHVCLLTESHEPSGMWSHMTTLAAELRRRWRVSLVVREKSIDEAPARQAHWLELDVLTYENEVSELEGWFRRSSVAVLHVHAGVAWEGHHAVLVGRRAGVQVVVRTEHLPQLITTNDQRGAHHALVRQLDRLICVSDGVARSFVASGTSREAITVVRNGTRALKAPPQRLGVPAETPLVLAVGRLVAQ
jgi:hypothetical protein